MNRKIQVLSLVVVLLVAAGRTAFAGMDEGPMGDPGKMEQWKQKMEKKWEKIAEEVGLSEEQRAKLKEQKESGKEQKKQSWAEMKKLKEEIKTELQKDNFDEAKVRALHTQVKGLQAKMADDRLEAVLGVRKILTAEQFKKFDEIRDKDHREWKGKKDKFDGLKDGGMPPPPDGAEAPDF